MKPYLLSQWLDVVSSRAPQPSPEYLVVCFPDDGVRDAYLADAENRPEEEVRSVLRAFVGGSRSLGLLDALHLEALKARPVDVSGDGWQTRFSEYDRRSILAAAGKVTGPTWEGLTWVLDLLPHAPAQAVEVLRAYTYAHAQVLPDLRLAGLSDAQDLVRTRYVARGSMTAANALELLLTLGGRDFEHLTAALYRAMGYQVEVTPAQKDGGKDVVAARDGETLYVECKNWRGKVPVDVVAGLLGRVETDRVTRGVVVATSGFTTGPMSAEDFASRSPSRLALLPGTAFVTLLNEHLGSEWHRRVGRIIHGQAHSPTGPPVPDGPSL